MLRHKVGKCELILMTLSKGGLGNPGGKQTERFYFQKIFFLCCYEIKVFKKKKKKKTTSWPLLLVLS